MQLRSNSSHWDTPVRKNNDLGLAMPVGERGCLILFLLLLLVIVPFSPAISQSVGDYRSHQSGNWSDPNAWERWDGVQWVTPAPAFPSFLDGSITLLSPHGITLDTSIAVDQCVVGAGATMTIDVGKTLTVSDGADSIDVVVEGTMDNYGAVTSTGRISFENGAQYVHLVPAGGGSIPISTWRDGSTCEVDSAGNGGTTIPAPSSFQNQSFYNFVWNSPRQGGNIGINFPDGYVFRGNVTIMNTGGTSYQWRWTNLSAGQTKNIYIRGDVNVNGANTNLTATGSSADTLAKAVINIDGNLNISAGKVSLNNSGSAYAEWRIKGDINVTGGTLTSGTSGGNQRRTLSFVNSGPQSFTVSGGSIGAAFTYRVTNGANLQLGFPLTLNGVLSIDSGTVITSTSNLLTIPAGGTVIAGGSTSYVDGPLAMTIATTTPTALTFPIGKGNVYRPIVLNATMDAATSSIVRAEMFNASPVARNLPTALSEISSTRYYTLSKGAGANMLSCTLQLNYGLDDSVFCKDSLRIAMDDGAGNWVNLGGSGTADSTGTITSNVFGSLTTNDIVLAHVSANFTASLPAITTISVDSNTISTTSAVTGGNVTNDGGAAVSIRGVCWNTSGSPTIMDSKTTDGSGTGVFSSALTSLSAGIKYYVRSYATNSAGTSYGGVESFSTLAWLSVPTVSTDGVNSIVNTTASGYGTVRLWGGTTVTERGVCWSTLHSPTVADNKNSSGSGTGSFIVSIGGLTLGTTYYARAYAINSSGTAYGSEISFSTSAPQPDVVKTVDQNGGGDYTTVQSALNDVPSNYTGKWFIRIKPGVYYEKLLLPSNRINVVLVGENPDSTILTYDDYADKGGVGTSGSYSVAIDASDFTAVNITFRNTYSPQPGVTGTQAVALRTNGDRMAFYNCRMLGFQDTYYTWSNGRLYMKDCFVQGSVDFIFGRSVAVFDSCTINCIRNGGTLTAANTDVNYAFGYVFLNCTITSDSIGYDGNPITSIYLGRPWQAAPRTVFLHCTEPSTLSSAGWLSWNVSPALYAEYQCSGSGSGTSGRVSWSSQLTDQAAASYTLASIFAKSTSPVPYPSDWMPQFPGDLTAVDQSEMDSHPASFLLSQAFPNPFNPRTNLEFSVLNDGMTTLRVFNSLGQQVTTLFDGNAQHGRTYRVTFDAGALSSGIYFARLESSKQRIIRKLLLIK
jgi:pectin methylesterase-like acyl-CoA thioesterase